MVTLKETFINKNERYLIETRKQNTNNISSLYDVYDYGLKKYGRCIGKIGKDKYNKTKHIGYIFEMRDKKVNGETFVKEVWLSI